MLNKLKLKSDQERNIIYLNIYEEANKKVDTMEALVSRAMSRGRNIAHLYSENYIIGLNHHSLFHDYYHLPYDKSIINRLKEIFKEPEFRVKSERITNPDAKYVDIYVVYIEWEQKIVNVLYCK